MHLWLGDGEIIMATSGIIIHIELTITTPTGTAIEAMGDFPRDQEETTDTAVKFTSRMVISKETEPVLLLI